MGTKILGNQYMLWVESATPGTYVLPAGQGNIRISRGSSKIDTSSKDDGRYGSGAPGLIDLGVSGSLRPKLPDTAYTRLETLANANPPVPFNIQIRKNGTAATSSDAVFQCSMYSNLDNTDFPQNGVGEASYSLMAAAAPTIDALA